MRSSAVAIGNSALASQYNDLRSDAFGGSFLLPHEQTVPDLTLKVEAGVYYTGATRVIFAGGNSPSFTAPVTNPRIDLLAADNAGVLSRVVGTEAASPAVPAYPADKIVICEVFNRVGQTTIRDTDQGSNGYIKQDVRPVLGGTYISSDAQVDAAAAISSSKLNFNSNVLPDVDATRNLGSSVKQWNEVRAIAFYKNGVAIGTKFGGTGADGALSISSGTTTLSFGGAQVLVKNYASISITGTAALAFSTPHNDGSTAILRSQGDVTITSTTVPAVDLRNMGGAGGAGAGGSNLGNGSATRGGTGGGHSGGKGGFNYGEGNPANSSVGGAGGGGGGGVTVGSDGASAGSAVASTGVSFGGFGGVAVPIVSPSYSFAHPGGGGGGGAGGMDNAGQQSAGAAGGLGGGGLVIECGGALNITSTFNSAGAAGSNSGTSPGASGGGGGGGGGGSILVVYATLTANTATFTLTGGAAGTAGAGTRQSGSSGGAGANGSSLVAANIFLA